jgi:hypothetical protein
LKPVNQEQDRESQQPTKTNWRTNHGRRKDSSAEQRRCGLQDREPKPAVVETETGPQICHGTRTRSENESGDRRWAGSTQNRNRIEQSTTQTENLTETRTSGEKLASGNTNDERCCLDKFHTRAAESTQELESSGAWQREPRLRRKHARGLMLPTSKRETGNASAREGGSRNWLRR